MKRFLVGMPFFLFILFDACCIPSNQLDLKAFTSVVQTLTATMWTPTPITPSATPVPDQTIIVDALNSVLRGADPLAEALDAKFYVIDVGFDTSGTPPVATTLRIHIECEPEVERTRTGPSSRNHIADSYRM